EPRYRKAYRSSWLLPRPPPARRNGREGDGISDNPARYASLRGRFPASTVSGDTKLAASATGPVTALLVRSPPKASLSGSMTQPHPAPSRSLDRPAAALRESGCFVEAGAPRPRDARCAAARPGSLTSGRGGPRLRTRTLRLRSFRPAAPGWDRRREKPVPPLPIPSARTL